MKLLITSLWIGITFVILVTSRLDVNWNRLTQRELAENLQRTPNTNRAKNVILFIGDGMGPTTLTATRFYKAYEEKISIEKTHLSWDRFPTIGLSKTYNADRMTPDSASTATALMSGVKTNYLTVGCNAKVEFAKCESVQNNEVKSFFTEAEHVKWTGLVTTTRVTHATPSAVYSYSPSRYYESFAPAGCTRGDIATQLVNSDLRVILGGGTGPLLPYQKGGWRKDGKDLITKWKQIRENNKQNYAYIATADEMDHLGNRKLEYLMGLFSSSHLTTELDKENNNTQPSIEQMTRQAIRTLKNAPDGYFLLVEGGLIDKGHHANRARAALEETLALDRAVKAAVELTNEDDTLLIVTADHSHVMSFGAYIPVEASPLDTYNDPEWGPTDKKPHLAIQYANGPGYYKHRQDINNRTVPRWNLTGVDTGAKDFVQDSAVPLKYDTHGAEDVTIFARGPMAHIFSGVHEQAYVAHAIRYAACTGGSSEHCNRVNSNTGISCISSSVLWLAVTMTTFSCLMT